jgi:transcriptional regulator with XRE-family HTH domain
MRLVIQTSCDWSTKDHYTLVSVFLGIIRRWRIRDQVPLREIAKRLGVSRNTVLRHLRSGTIEPAFAERRDTRAINKYAFQISVLLTTEAARLRKERRTLKQIHDDLKELGYEGSYGRGVRENWREGQTERGNPASKRTAISYDALGVSN